MVKKIKNKQASAFGAVGGNANFKKHGVEGPLGMRARGKLGALARWGNKGASKDAPIASKVKVSRSAKVSK